MTPPTNGNSKLRFMMVELEGSDATIAQAIATITNLINPQSLSPAPPSAPALPQATQTPAALPAPDQGRESTPPAGGANTGELHGRRQPNRPRRVARGRIPRALPAAPAQASIKERTQNSEVRTQNDGRRNGVLLECQEKPGKTFTVREAAELARLKPQSVHGALYYAEANGKEWATAGAFHFRKSKTTLTPPSPAAVVNRTGAAPMNYESKPRARGDLGPINSHLVGGAARITHADHG